MTQKNQELVSPKNYIEVPIVTHIKSDDQTCNHYTGFKTLHRYMAVFDFLDFGGNGENVILYHSQNKQDVDGRGRPRPLSPMESLLLTLMRVRRNFSLVHISFLFKVSLGTVSNIITTYINYIYIYVFKIRNDLYMAIKKASTKHYA